ncbi:hypothetical protein NKG05_12190 [Oerskovia sp. M15]
MRASLHQELTGRPSPPTVRSPRSPRRSSSSRASSPRTLCGTGARRRPSSSSRTARSTSST